MNALDKAIEIVGGEAALARHLKTSPQRVNNWRRRGGRVPVDVCVPIEIATERGVLVEELRPDLAEQWAYLRATPSTQKPGHGA